MSLISDLYADGTIVLHHSYNAGHFDDLSGNGNNGTQTLVQLTRNGCKFNKINSNISVLDASELQLTNLSIVVFFKKGFYGMASPTAFVSKRDAGGTNYQFGTALSAIALFDGVNTRTASSISAMIGKKCLAVSTTATGIPQLYANGVFVSNFSSTVNIAVNDASVYIGNVYSLTASCYEDISDVLIFNRVLTATEHAQIYAELQAVKWPFKIFSKDWLNLQPMLSDSTLVGSWYMKPYGNKIVDLTAIKNGTLTGGINHSKTILGEALFFDGLSGYVAVGNTGQTVKTVAFWVNSITTTEDFIDFDGGIHTIEVIAGTITATGFSSPTIYIDGEASSTGFTANNWHRIVVTTNTGFTASNLNIGKETIYLEGKMISPEIYSDTKSISWVSSDYLNGARAIQFKTEWGSTSSSTSISSGYIDNLPFYVSSGGTYQVVTTTLKGNKVKVIKAITAGTISLNGAAFWEANEGNYGSWVFWIYRASSVTNLDVAFISDTAGNVTATGHDAFVLRLNVDNQLQMREIVSAVDNAVWNTDNNLIADGSWIGLKTTRSYTGSFTTYYATETLSWTQPTLASGSNPFTDTTTPAANFIDITLGVGDMVCLGDINGEYSITKYLGVI